MARPNNHYLICLCIFTSLCLSAMDHSHVQIFNSDQQATSSEENSATTQGLISRASKRRKTSNQSIHEHPLTPAQIVFGSPEILRMIAKKLNGLELCYFARICRTCHRATQLDYVKEKCIANELSMQEISPIQHVLAIAQGQETVRVHGIVCSTAPVISCLHKVDCSLLNESSRFKNAIFQPCMHDQDVQEIPAPLRSHFSSSELMTLEPLKYLAITIEDRTEASVIEKVKATHNAFPSHGIILDLSSSDDQFYPGNINESLMCGLEQYPIISLHCEEQALQNGLACLGKLHQLRELYIRHCNVMNTAIPDELCQGLPLLTVLQITNSGITKISPLIGTLKHLVELDLSNNFLIAIPDSLHTLTQLKRLNLSQKKRFLSAQQLKAANLTGLTSLSHLLVAYHDEINPLPELNRLSQLQMLYLSGDCKQLPLGTRPMLNLQALNIFNSHLNRFSIRTQQFPALQSLHGKLKEDVLISYQTMLHLARQIKACHLLTIDNALAEINTLVDLWNMIQANLELIINELPGGHEASHIDNDAKIAIIEILMKETMAATTLRNLIYENAEPINSCRNYIQNILLEHQPISTCNTEAQLVNPRPHNTLLTATINTIACYMAKDIPIYKTQLNKFAEQALRSIIQHIEQMLITIEKGYIIKDKQFNACISTLKLFIRTSEHVTHSTTAIANLLLHHAINHNNITNAGIMLTFNADINSVDPLTHETVLHSVIRKRIDTHTKDMHETLDHIICFLLKNQANKDQKNRLNQSPLDLVPTDNTLLRQKMT